MKHAASPPDAGLSLSKRARSRWEPFWFILLGAALLSSFWITEINPGLFLRAESRANMWEFLAGTLPPDLSWPFLASLVTPTFETLQVALMGMLIAMLIGFPLALLAASNLTFSGILNTHVQISWWRWGWRGLLYLLARALLNLFRAVPEFVWALMFVRAVGLGPFSGVLAIGVAYGGILGKVYAEILEEVEPRSLEALQSTGASKLQILCYGFLPQVLPHGVAYTLYRWECAIRAAAIMGFIGAGGIGQQLELAMRMFDYRQAMTCLLIIFLLVTAVDHLSTLLQRYLSRRRKSLPGSVSFWSLGLLLVFLWAYRGTGVQPMLLVSAEGRGQVLAFITQLFPPDLSFPFLQETLYAAGETLAIALMGTLLAIGIGCGLSLPAARTLMVDGHVYAQERVPGAERYLRLGGFLLARGLLNILRAIPELIWALIFILAVGLGPFAGVLALGIHNGGVLGRLYAAFLDAAPPEPVEAVRSTGANGLQVLCYAILPQVFPLSLAYTFYRWEVNIRAAAILGVVGAGGLGTQIHMAINLFHYARLLTLIGIVFLIVTLADTVSGLLRRYWL
jgi:phosphonate transport system permease protein